MRTSKFASSGASDVFVAVTSIVPVPPANTRPALANSTMSPASVGATPRARVPDPKTNSTVFAGPAGVGRSSSSDVVGVEPVVVGLDASVAVGGSVPSTVAAGTPAGD